ncbi:MAG: VOC family protein [Chloroflexota bacterium]
MVRIRNAYSGFAVKDLDAARDFYRGKLGLEVSDEEMGTLGLHLPGGARVVVYAKEDHVPAVFTILNLAVDDIESAVDDLTAAGVAMERYEGQGFQADAKGIVRDERGPAIAWFTDPSGNIISVLQEQPARVAG